MRLRLPRRRRRDPFKVLERKFKLKRSSGDHDAPGVHSKTSYHYRDASWGGVQAYDYGDALNSTAKLVAVGRYFRQCHRDRYCGKQVREVFGPFPFHIKNGVVIRGEFPGHGDHLHIALSD